MVTLYVDQAPILEMENELFKKWWKENKDMLEGMAYYKSADNKEGDFSCWLSDSKTIYCLNKEYDRAEYFLKRLSRCPGCTKNSCKGCNKKDNTETSEYGMLSQDVFEAENKDKATCQRSVHEEVMYGDLCNKMNNINNILDDNEMTIWNTVIDIFDTLGYVDDYISDEYTKEYDRLHKMDVHNKKRKKITIGEIARRLDVNKNTLNYRYKKLILKLKDYLDI